MKNPYLHIVLIDGSEVFAGSDMDCYQLLYLLIGDPLAEILASDNTSTLHGLSQKHKNANRIEITNNGTPILKYDRAVTLESNHEQHHPDPISFIRQ